MSDTYIPELIELDSYWKKAVEDAIYDTLKGEKRVFYALKNRKKIKQKLAKLGFRPSRSHSQTIFKKRKEDRFKYRSPSKSDWEPVEEKSLPSRGNVEDQVPHSPSDKAWRLRSCSRSRGPSQEKRGTSQEKRGPSQNPDSPLLGDGSHEKIKKSQNSFNYEPMGSKSNPVLLESEEDFREVKNSKNSKNFDGNKKKEIEWLHVRGDRAFKDSDTEISNNEACKEVENEKYERRSTVRDMNYFIKNEINLSSTQSPEMSGPSCSKQENKKIPRRFDLQEDLFWENEVKKAIKENAGSERKLFLALAKRKILSKGTRRTNNKIQIQKSLIDNRKRRPKNLLSPFVKFYLEVYRELCRKRPVEEIAQEAVTRWRNLKQKETESDSKSEK